MKKEININLFNGEGCDSRWPSNNAKQFLTWLSEKVNSVPLEYQDEVIFYLDARNEYDMCYPTLSIYYNRLETDEEEAKREIDEDYRRKQQVERDLRLLAVLKAKYG